MEIKLPDEPSKLGLQTWEAEGQRWDGYYHQAYFPFKTGEESLDRWMPYFERALEEKDRQVQAG